MRIVSLLPSATDIVCSLGLREHLVGRTHECDWPPGVETVPVVTSDVLDTAHMRSREINEAIGGAIHSGSSIYHLDNDALEEAKPDLILTQELCDVCAVSYRDVAQAARMLEADTKVVSLEPTTIDEIFGNVSLVGELTGTSDRAAEVIADGRSRLAALSLSGRPRVACIEWLEPIFAGGHWVPDQVEAAGGIDVLGPRHAPSYEIGWDKVLEAQPEIVVLMPCGYAIERTLSELDTFPLDELPATYVVDGSSFFNRPGPRVVRGAEILHAIFAGDELDPDEARRIR